ncbi:hypothetical protein EIN_117910 [Entamoeba invadens IP1]|uniref:Uncharacterized protein n=1 Tax=Entamoeba invadens IP1 TaxID=370355 RepID=L7FMX5_ENTIV|nr:hypothetical protein EIN_117910 [Entamoeba invadens IP1]ELP92217.1 hypothetical protein EIN_117910 [Entamoeba invadens IP1]|eukprot:XP_004258988.1 hypothetical protein EIN_117910 [Entamoeba invadens IP1]
MSTTSTTTTTATTTRQQFLTVGTGKGQGMTTKGRSTKGTTHDRRSKKSKKGLSKGGPSKGSGSLSNQDILEDLNKTPIGLYTFLISIILPCATVVGCTKLRSQDRREKLWAIANLILGIGFVFIAVVVVVLYLIFEL